MAFWASVRARVCLDARERDGPLVVQAEEDQRGLEDAGEVHRLLAVAVRRGAVTEVDHRDAVLSLVARRAREPDRVGHLARDRDAERQVPDAVGDAHALRVSRVVEDEVARAASRATCRPATPGSRAPASPSGGARRCSRARPPRGREWGRRCRCGPGAGGAACARRSAAPGGRCDRDAGDPRGESGARGTRRRDPPRRRRTDARPTGRPVSSSARTPPFGPSSPRCHFPPGRPRGST